MRTQLRVRTEYSFGKAYGPLQKVLDACATYDIIGICDSDTWGHIPFYNATRKAGKRPMLGWEVAIVANPAIKDQGQLTAAIFPTNAAGLRELYSLSYAASRQFYFTPRLSWDQVLSSSSKLVMIFQPHPSLADWIEEGRGNWYIEVNPSSYLLLPRTLRLAQRVGLELVAASDVLYPRPQDRGAYEIIAGRNRNSKPTPTHILSRAELRAAMPDLPEVAYENADRIGLECSSVELPKAENVVYHETESLEDLCRKGIRTRRLRWNKEYEARLQRELELIQSKGFKDYFHVIGDMIQEAKRHMLVGPGRGSSSGSLVCYLLGIVDINPIEHGLLFERFIDITRKDFPDIDIDFPDSKRAMVIDYLRERYGPENVAHLGTISRYKAKSAITEVSKALRVPEWEVREVKGAMIERSGGDSRASFCILDTFEQLEVGQKLLAKYPEMRAAADLEEHARHTGVHAAGIIVCNDEVWNFCGVDSEGVAHIDKIDAESLNLLKIDALGLRTLTVIEDTLEQIGKPFSWMSNVQLNDKAAFKVLNDGRFSGIFQFEGAALRSLTNQMKVHDFNDIVAITALARPGPLNSGSATEFIRRRTGAEPVRYAHPVLEPHTRETYGIVIYQEQVMAVVREVGQLSWEETTSIRKAMSKSLGEEFFNQFWLKFLAGAMKNGVDAPTAENIWKSIMTFGSWAFNKSHAVAYGMVSYWTALLKAHWPLEFAAAALRHAKDNDQVVRLLRELVREGYEYSPLDRDRSRASWSVQDGKLIGGLTGVVGVGKAMAADILLRRETGVALTSRQAALLENPKIPYAEIFEGERRFGDMYRNPLDYNILSGQLSHLIDVQQNGTYVIIGKLREKDLRDLNEFTEVQKRGGRKITDGPTVYLNMIVEDDTDQMMVAIGRFKFEAMGRQIVEEAQIGDWFLMKIDLRNGYRKGYITKIKRIGEAKE